MEAMLIVMTASGMVTVPMKDKDTAYSAAWNLANHGPRIEYVFVIDQKTGEINIVREE